MHSCTAPGIGHGPLLQRASGVHCNHASRHSLPSARQTAAPRRRQCGSSALRAAQQDPQHDEQEAEAPSSSPKFLFDEDPPPPAGGSNPFASVFKAALSRQPGAADQPQPPPVQEQPAEQPAQQTDDMDEQPNAPGPKFLFEEDLAPPAAEGGAGPDILSANPAFASVFKASLERSKAEREASSSSGSSSDSSMSAAAGAGAAPVQQGPPPAAPPAAAAAPEATPATAPQQLLDPQQAGRRLLESERLPSAAEEVLLSALRDSRRTIIALQNMHKDVEASLKREEQQFNRLHFALQKAKSDAARMAALQQMLDRRGPPK